MRLRRLQLIRYGKFEGRTIDFPAAKRDFHFILGPNEAGKSTVRMAVAELLFGMPRSSPLGFIHPQSELRLGASIENGAEQLNFQRIKGTKQTLRSPLDAVLPDAALAPFTGTADLAFFEKMFGLDRSKMIKGGKDILDSSKDVGQVLFQSAAGIASLGSIRDALADEANRLWAPRKSADRAWYIGQQLLEEASASLKGAAVRTRAWSDRQAAVAEAQERFEAAQACHAELEIRRSRLERVRRVAPQMAGLRTREAELRELGEVLELPADAGAILTGGQAELAAAELVLRLRTDEVERCAAQLKGTVVDHALFALKEDVESLEAMRHQCRNHAEDIRRRGTELDLLMDEVRATCAQLGWPGDEDAVHALMPSVLVLKEIANLIRDRGALEQAAISASQALEKKQDETARLRAQLAAIPRREANAALRAALSSAQTLRQTEASTRRLKTALSAAESALETAEQALGSWRKPPEALRSMVLPSIGRLASLKSDRQLLASDVKSAAERLEGATGRVEAATLALEQYSHGHDIVTPAQVQRARAQRDLTWGAIKLGELSLEEGGPELDHRLHLSDELVDTQLGSVTEFAELQSLQQGLEREQNEQAGLRQMFERRETALFRFDDAWSGFAVELGLPGIHLEDAPSWLARQETVLAAVAVVETRRREVSIELDATVRACATLHALLVAAGVPEPDGSSLEALCSAAQSHVDAVDEAAARTTFLSERLEESNGALLAALASQKTSREAFERWQQAWQEALGKARLANSSGSVAMAEAAVALVFGIRERLARVNGIRRERIDTMRSDLTRFSADARRLATGVDETLLALDDASISTELSRRLAVAIAAHSAAQRIQNDLFGATAKAREAREQVESINARLRPLFERAGVAAANELLPLIARSDRRRELTLSIEAARESLAAGGDGLSVAGIAAEVDETDVMALQASLSEVKRALTESVAAQAELATELSAARHALSAISGGASAAVAEAKRQEALAVMAEASDRYIRVATASKLLRWAIDRYRDAKQGPMLSRASAIFSQLTLGGFSKLIVDYEKPALSLAAIRSGGQVVEIAGMSEGTCDQLYLALRLAALELHLEQAMRLPFIADDLFVNFDDTRAVAGLKALGDLSTQTQVVFLSHHEHLVPLVRNVFGAEVNIVSLQD